MSCVQQIAGYNSIEQLHLYMAELIALKSISNDTGSVTVIERVLPFTIKRIFYLTDVQGSRGKHSHRKTIVALTCQKGSCTVEVKNADGLKEFKLDDRSKCLVIHPLEWHQMKDFSSDAILLCLASEDYDAEDYIRS